MGKLIEYTVAARPFPGEQVSGDSALVESTPEGVLIAVVDGLGHGEAAAAAAGIAIATLAEHAAAEPTALVQYCHQSLKASQGVALSLASINVNQSTMIWLGVGNVDGLLLKISASPPVRESLVMRGGVVGYRLPPLRSHQLAITVGDLLVFTTDGISSDFSTRLPPGDPVLRHQPVQEIADRLLARFGKPSDDALVLVARYLGPSS